MNPSTRERLHALTLEFYQANAEAFARTRARPWAGMARVLARCTAPRPRVLDVGCGNGRLIVALRERWPAGFEYLGVDASEAMLAVARRLHPDPALRFARGDFAAGDPERALPAGEHDLVALFGVLHHVPSEPARRALLRAAAARLAPGALLALTSWRFERSARLARRRVPKDRYRDLVPGEPIDPAQLEPGDELLRFGQGGALRYCHFADDAELARSLHGLALCEVERFAADGEGAALNDYLVLRRTAR